MAKPENQILKNYKLAQVLGIGSFGKVKMGIHKITGQKVAIKIISKQKIQNLKMEDKIKREIQLLKFFKHPHIIHIYEFFETSTQVFVIMEYISGGELFDLISKKGRMKETETRRIFQELISGVEYCHAHKVTHRDLKPENLLLDEFNHIKLADFGLSNIMIDGNYLKTSCGSPNYAAPEVISGKVYSGSEIDVWSCGVILYALLSGGLPFDDECISTLFYKIREAKYEMHNYFPKGAQDLIRKMLQPNPLHRITLQEIKNHPWFTRNMPLYLTVIDPNRSLDSENPLDENILKKMFTIDELKLNQDEKDKISLNILKNERLDYCVVYDLLYDEKQKKTMQICSLIDDKPYVFDLNSVKMNRKKFEDELLAETEKEQEAKERRKTEAPHSAKNGNSKQLIIKEEGENPGVFHWQYGIKFTNDPVVLLKHIFDTLIELSYEWKMVDNSYKIRCRPKIPKEQWLKINEDSLYEMQKNFLKFEIQLYRKNKSTNSYIIDILKVTGSAMNFLEFCHIFLNILVKHVKVLIQGYF